MYSGMCYRNPVTVYAIQHFHVSAPSAEGSKQKGTKYGPGRTERPAINRISSV